MHSPASRRSSSRATRGRTVRPRLCTLLPGTTGRARLLPPPTSLWPQEGRCRHQRRPVLGTPAIRGRAPGTSSARPPPPPPAFPPRALTRSATQPRPDCARCLVLGVLKRTWGSAPRARPPRPHPHAPRTCLLRFGPAAATAHAARRQHSRGGVAPSGLRGEAVVATAATVLTVAEGQIGTRRNPRPTRTCKQPPHPASSCLSDAPAPRSRRL